MNGGQEGPGYLLPGLSWGDDASRSGSREEKREADGKGGEKRQCGDGKPSQITCTVVVECRWQESATGKGPS